MKFVVRRGTDQVVPAWDDPQAFVHLDSLVDRCAEAAHVLVLWDADLIAESDWVRGARPNRQAIVEQILKESQSGVYKSVSEAGGAETILSGPDAAFARNLALTPLYVVVENSLRDRALVEAAIRLLRPGNLYQLSVDPPVPPAVEFVNGGGKDGIPDISRQQATDLARNGLPVRLVAIRDSDRSEEPLANDVLEQALQRFREEIEAIGPRAAAWIWSKRAAENYIPDVYWEEYIGIDPENPNFVNGMRRFLGLSISERDTFDMGERHRGLKKVSKSIDENRPYHLERFRGIVERLDEATRTGWVESLRARDHRLDFGTLFDLMEKLL